MKRKHVIMVGLIALLLVALTGCVRSLEPSTVESELPTATLGESGVAAPTSDVMQQLEMFATQTVMASMGITGTIPIVPAEGTLVPGVDQQPAGGQPPTGGEQPAAGQPPAGGEQTAQPPAGGEQTAQPPAGGEQPTQAPAGSEPTATAVPPAAGEPSGELVVPTGIPTVTPPNSYTLHTGEYIYCIARRFDVNPTDLLALNGLTTSSYVYAGLELKIPQNGNPFPGQRSLMKHPAMYTVSSGETIYSIACQFGDVTPEAIAYANNLGEPYKLQSGQELIIP
jgi:LysM repeat protein